mmetsp:Transcript_123545/g.192931  ORF Transcript_123545/g.192931 Transcript_123545/m.192931 type:complete len:162 (-) Transcript_123545:103-588(-)
MASKVWLLCATIELLCHSVKGQQCTRDSGCECGLSAEEVSRIHQKVSAPGAYMYAIPNMRCTVSGRAKFQSCGIPLKEDSFTPSDIDATWSNFVASTDSTWKYMQCKYPVHEGGMVMHSYVFVDGELKGDGFDVSTRPCSELRSTSRLLSVDKKAALDTVL